MSRDSAMNPMAIVINLDDVLSSFRQRAGWVPLLAAAGDLLDFNRFIRRQVHGVPQSSSSAVHASEH
jgi:hypothetical protein